MRRNYIHACAVVEFGGQALGPEDESGSSAEAPIQSRKVR